MFSHLKVFSGGAECCCHSFSHLGVVVGVVGFLFFHDGDVTVFQVNEPNRVNKTVMNLIRAVPPSVGCNFAVSVSNPVGRYYVFCNNTVMLDNGGRSRARFGDISYNSKMRLAKSGSRCFGRCYICGRQRQSGETGQKASMKSTAVVPSVVGCNFVVGSSNLVACHLYSKKKMRLDTSGRFRAQFGDIVCNTKMRLANSGRFLRLGGDGGSVGVGVGFVVVFWSCCFRGHQPQSQSGQNTSMQKLTTVVP